LAQLAPQAWSFSWELISPEKSPEVQFFGASCLGIKVSRWESSSFSFYYVAKITVSVL
jgi:hypothetical protein